MGVIYSGVYPFLISLFLLLFLFFIFPQIVTYLPNMLMKWQEIAYNKYLGDPKLLFL